MVEHVLKCNFSQSGGVPVCVVVRLDLANVMAETCVAPE